MYRFVRSKAIISLIILVFAFTACQSVPENVKDRNEELESLNEVETSQTVKEPSPETVSSSDLVKEKTDTSEYTDLDYIRAHLKEDASKKYGTITVKYASAGEAKTMPTYKIEVGGNPELDFSAITKQIYGDKYDVDNKSLYSVVPYDKEKTEPTEETMRPELKYRAPQSFFYDINEFYPDKNDGMISSFTFTDGTCWGSQTGAIAVGDDYWCDQRNPTPTATYFPSYEDITNISYKMKSGTEWKLTDAVKFIEDYWNKCFSANDSDKYLYKVWRVDVLALSENYGYKFTLAQFDENGCCYDTDTYDIFTREKNKAQQNKRFFLAPESSAYCIEKETLTRYIKGYSYKKVEKIQDNERYITLGSAMEKLRKTLAPNINLAFNTAELKYVITCDKYPKKDFDDVVEYKVNYCKKTCDLYIRPYWCFKSTNGYFDEWHSTVNYYVDAITGDVHIVGMDF